MAGASNTTLKGYFNTGDIPTEVQFGQLIDSFSPSSLGTFNPAAVSVNSVGTYSDYTTTGNITISASGGIEGIWQKVVITFNGSHTLTLPNGAIILDNSITDGAAPTSGEYNLYIIYSGAKYQFNLVPRATVV